MNLKGSVFFGLAGILIFAATASAQLLFGSKDELLDPEKAFRISARALDARNVEVEFRIAEGYYMYRDRFSFATESGERLAEVEIPRGTPKEDQFFGRTETFRRLVRIRVPRFSRGCGKGKREAQGHLSGLRRHRHLLCAARAGG